MPGKPPENHCSYIDGSRCIPFIIINIQLRMQIICVSQLHKGTFCRSSFRYIYYYGSNKSTGKEAGKSHLCELVKSECYFFSTMDYLAKVKMLQLSLSENPPQQVPGCSIIDGSHCIRNIIVNNVHFIISLWCTKATTSMKE